MFVCPGVITPIPNAKTMGWSTHCGILILDFLKARALPERGRLSEGRGRAGGGGRWVWGGGGSRQNKKKVQIIYIYVTRLYHVRVYKYMYISTKRELVELAQLNKFMLVCGMLQSEPR